MEESNRSASSGDGPPPAASASQAPRGARGYAGDISPTVAYEWWRKGDAVLVDVRSDAEREWVGFIPGAVALAWKQWPGMATCRRFRTSFIKMATKFVLMIAKRRGVAITPNIILSFKF